MVLPDRVCSKPLSIRLILLLKFSFSLKPNIAVPFAMINSTTPIAEVREAFKLEESPSNMLSLKPKLAATWKRLGNINDHSNMKELTPLSIIFKVSDLYNFTYHITHCFTSFLIQNFLSYILKLHPKRSGGVLQKRGRFHIHYTLEYYQALII